MTSQVATPNGGDARRGGATGRRGGAVILAAGLILFGATPSRAQSPASRSQPDSAAATLATRGMGSGAIAGGVLGAVTLGFLSQALCDASSCSPSLAAATMMGLVGGATFGGVAGLVLGSAIRRGPGPAADGLPSADLSLSGGGRWAGASEIRGLDAYLGLRATRSTTTRVRFGLEVAYLGGGTESNTFTGPNRDGVPIRFDEHAERAVWTVGLVAVRRLGEPPAAGPYVLASTGVYPLEETLTFMRSGGVEPGTPTEGRSHSWQPAPGVAVGAGTSQAVGSKLWMGGEARVHVLVGVGDDGVLPLVSLAIQARVGGG